MVSYMSVKILQIIQQISFQLKTQSHFQFVIRGTGPEMGTQQER